MSSLICKGSFDLRTVTSELIVSNKQQQLQTNEVYHKAQVFQQSKQVPANSHTVNSEKLRSYNILSDMTYRGPYSVHIVDIYD